MTEDEVLHPQISTGVAQWECMRIKGLEMLPSRTVSNATGSRQKINGLEFPWGFQSLTTASSYAPALITAEVVDSTTYHGFTNQHILRPATLPAMLDDDSTNIFPNEPKLSGVCFAPRTKQTITVDLGNYFCFYPKITVSGGKGSKVTFGNCEALFGEDRLKGNRDETDRKKFESDYDIFETDGGASRCFETFWWRAGRFVEITVETGDEALTIDDVCLYETRYPFLAKSTFECSEEALNQLIPISLRSIEMCSHETYMDCPFYEQLMYIGDTRIQSLITFVYSNDTRLPKKAIDMFVESMKCQLGLPKCAHPSGGGKIIPSFCLWLIGMAHDYMMWVDDKQFIQEIMPSLRRIVELYFLEKSESGILKTPPGWNYVDWVDDKSNADWFYGEPNDSKTGFLSLFNLQMVHVLELLAELEEFCEERTLAARNTKLAEQLYLATDRVFWDSEKQVFADDPNHKFYCEQTQVLALLCKCLPEERASLIEKSITDDNVFQVKCSIYFSHYLFEVLRARGKANYFLKRLEEWNLIKELDFKTTPEVLHDSTRSDCHAWGAHPVYHFLSTILGIRPGDYGFKKVQICPMIGDLNFVKGAMVHPLGEIKVSIQRCTDGYDVEIDLPEGLPGSFKSGNAVLHLNPGHQKFLVLDTQT